MSRQCLDLSSFHFPCISVSTFTGPLQHFRRLSVSHRGAPMLHFVLAVWWNSLDFKVHQEPSSHLITNLHAWDEELGPRAYSRLTDCWRRLSQCPSKKPWNLQREQRRAVRTDSDIDGVNKSGFRRMTESVKAG